MMPRLFTRIQHRLILPRNSERVEAYMERRWPFRNWEQEYQSGNIRMRSLPMPPDPWLYLAHRWAVEWYEGDEWQWLGDLEPDRHPFHLDHALYVVSDDAPVA